MDVESAKPYNQKTPDTMWIPFRASGVFAPLVGALVFKTSGGFEQSSQWVRFPYTPVSNGPVPMALQRLHATGRMRLFGLASAGWRFRPRGPDGTAYRSAS